MAELPTSWYVSEEPKTITVCGTDLSVKEISSEEYSQLVIQVTKGSSFDANRYGDLLIEKMVIDPKIENPSSLKPGIRGQLIRKLEDILGISANALKNLNEE